FFCVFLWCFLLFFFFSSRRRHTRFSRDWSSDVCSSDLMLFGLLAGAWPAFVQSRVFPLDALRGGAAVPMRGGAAGKVLVTLQFRSEERRVGKECRSRWAPTH